MLYMETDACIKPAIEKIYLKPARMHMSGGGAQAVTTVLGSCVSVTFFAAKERIGAITHAFLPEGSLAETRKNPGRFVTSSIAWTVRAFEKAGIPRGQLEVKLFGGAQMFRDVSGGGKPVCVGTQNVETALSTLNQFNLKLATQEIMGDCGRKLVFYPHLGEVWLKKFPGSRSSEEVTYG